MKCVFQDCQLEATETVSCKIGMTKQNVIVHVCKFHHDLLFDNSVSVSMELKEDKE